MTSESSSNESLPHSLIDSSTDGSSVERPSEFKRFSGYTPPEEIKPRYCVWEITLACDLGCKHCGSRAGNSRSERPDRMA